MNPDIVYRENEASATEIAEHLKWCDADFVPPLSTRVDLENYAGKIADAAMRFEAWSGDALIGLVAAYCNDSSSRTAYVTNVSVAHPWMRRGVAKHLLSDCIEYARKAGMLKISLAVGQGNHAAIALYRARGFSESSLEGPSVTMTMNL